MSRNKQPQNVKKDRSGYGNPDPDAKVVALSVEEIISKIIYTCKICKKEFHRNQNLQIHLQLHNDDPSCNVMEQTEKKKKVYVCPEPSCEYHEAPRALTGITAIKKHYFRFHGEKKWKCENCPRSYAAQSDLKKHLLSCASGPYKCECGTLFSSKHSFTAHKKKCEACPEGSGKHTATTPPQTNHPNHRIAPRPPVPPSSILVPFFWVPKPQNPYPYNIMNISQLSATAPASNAISTKDMDASTTWKMNDLSTRLTGNKRPRDGGSGSGDEANLEQCGGVGGSGGGQGGGAGDIDSWSDLDDLDLSSIDWDFLHDD